MNLSRLDRPGPAQRLNELLRMVPFLARRARWMISPPFQGFSDPFNGQRNRVEVVRRLRSRFEPDACIETGTFLASTTRHLAGWGIPVFSVELNPAWCWMAALSLRRFSNVSLICGDSRAALRALGQGGPFERPFIYLDAHLPLGDAANRLERHPLMEELALIVAAWDEAIVLVDDFLVPGEPGYGYDITEGVPLSSEVLELPSETSLAYPAIAPPKETGARRGAAYIGHGPDARNAIQGLVEDGMLLPSEALRGGAQSPPGVRGP